MTMSRKPEVAKNERSEATWPGVSVALVKTTPLRNRKSAMTTHPTGTRKKEAYSRCAIARVEIMRRLAPGR